MRDRKILGILGILGILLIGILSTINWDMIEVDRRKEISSNCTKFFESKKIGKTEKYIENIGKICKSNNEKLSMLTSK